MQHTETHHDDSKLLLVIGSVITMVVIGWAVLAGLSSRQGTVAISQAEPVQTIVAAEPAVFNTSLDPIAVVEPVLEPELELPAFEISPGENLIATGLEAFAAREFDRASAYFEAETIAQPEKAWAHYMLGLSNWKAGQLDGAVTAMEMAIELNSLSIKSRINLSRIQNANGQYAAALTAAEAALEIDASNPTALFMQGRSLYNLERVDEAVVALEKSLEFDSENGHVYNLLGLIGIQDARFQEAAGRLELATVYAGDVAHIQNNLGIALERTGDTAAAVAAYRRAAEIDPVSVKAQVNLARLAPLVEPEHPALAVVSGKGNSEGL
jgi:tetratricopeptide (TPR) repeat protein